MAFGDRTSQDAEWLQRVHAEQQAALEREPKRGKGRPRKWQNDAQRMACKRIEQREHDFNVRQVHLIIKSIAGRGDALYINPWDVVGETEEETFQKLAAFLKAQ